MISIIKRIGKTGSVALLCATALGLSVKLYAGDSTESSTKPTEHIVYIENMAFSPSQLQVKVGDSITWINKDFVPHTATALDRSWDSENLSKGDEYTLVVTADMPIDYYCFYHTNMVATIEIVE